MIRGTCIRNPNRISVRLAQILLGTHYKAANNLMSAKNLIADLA